MIAVCVAYGLGRHVKYLMMTKTPGQVETSLLLIVVVQVVAIHSFSVVKLSIAFLLIRLFNPKVWTKAALLVLPVILIGVTIVTNFVQIFQCNPVRTQWQPYLIPEGKGKCWDSSYYVGLGYALGSMYRGHALCRRILTRH